MVMPTEVRQQDRNQLLDDLVYSLHRWARRRGIVFRDPSTGPITTFSKKKPQQPAR